MAVGDSTPAGLTIWNRETQRMDTELVYGDEWMKLIYGTKPGRILANSVLVRHTPSKLYGLYQSSKLSRRKIEPFIRDFRIQMDEYEEGPFASFNDFFIRQFKPGKRPFTEILREMPAFAEARYVAFENVNATQVFPVKGEHLTAEAILADSELARSFQGGSVFIARLCPVDYHRYHYPDDGKTLKSYPVRGALHSVNPLALRFKSEILATNERRVSILETPNFGRIAYVEVGALCVGRIVQTHDEGQPFKRGDEKGYFLFGGSTVIVMGEPGKWIPDEDLLVQTSEGRETFVKLGARIARSLA